MIKDAALAVTSHDATPKSASYRYPSQSPVTPATSRVVAVHGGASLSEQIFAAHAPARNSMQIGSVYVAIIGFEDCGKITPYSDKLPMIAVNKPHSVRPIRRAKARQFNASRNCRGATVSDKIPAVPWPISAIC
jgi:hypothetical protein